MPPLPNSHATKSLMRLMARNPELTIADVELCPQTGEYRLKTEDERISVGNYPRPSAK